MKEQNTDIEAHYANYEKSVQAPLADIRFFRKAYQEIYGARAIPLYLREDFCGTALLSYNWIKQSPKHQALGIDLDERPVNYGLKHHAIKLKESEKDRIVIALQNVLGPFDERKRPDIVAALNFSYLLFKERVDLKKYFSSVFKTLSPKGLFILDIFGGTESMIEGEESRRIDAGLKYFWECRSFNPINHYGLFSIHFATKTKKDKKLHKKKNIFTYDWRLWTVPELVDILKEVGFKEAHVYWEGTDHKGNGSGQFYQKRTAKNCSGWVSYLVARP